jgi:hypothetical protein
MDPPKYKVIDNLTLPTMVGEIIFTILIVGHGHIDALAYSYCEDFTLPYEERRVSKKSFPTYKVIRMSRKTTYGIVTIDFVIPRFPDFEFKYPKKFDDVVWFLTEDGKNFTFFDQHLQGQVGHFATLKMFPSSVLQGKSEEMGIVPIPQAGQESPSTYRFHVPKTIVYSQAIKSLIFGAVRESLSVNGGPYNKRIDQYKVPETAVPINVETGEGADEFFRKLLQKLTGKSDLVFGDPLSEDELLIIEKVRALRARGIPI